MPPVTNAKMILQKRYIMKNAVAVGPQNIQMNDANGTPKLQYQNKFHGKAKKKNIGMSTHQQHGPMKNDHMSPNSPHKRSKGKNIQNHYTLGSTCSFKYGLHLSFVAIALPLLNNYWPILVL